MGTWDVSPQRGGPSHGCLYTTPRPSRPGPRPGGLEEGPAPCRKDRQSVSPHRLWTVRPGGGVYQEEDRGPWHALGHFSNATKLRRLSPTSGEAPARLLATRFTQEAHPVPPRLFGRGRWPTRRSFFGRAVGMDVRVASAFAALVWRSCAPRHRACSRKESFFSFLLMLLPPPSFPLAHPLPHPSPSLPLSLAPSHHHRAHQPAVAPSTGVAGRLETGAGECLARSPLC